MPAPQKHEPKRSRLHHLSIPRSKLARYAFGSSADRGAPRCLLAHVLLAATDAAPRYEYRRGERPPETAAPFYTKRRVLRAAVWDRIIGAFDAGDEWLALVTLRDYGWAVTIVEDQAVAS